MASMSTNEHENVEKHTKFGVFPGHMTGGPQGLGDPDDRTLRKVEKEVMIPKLMKLRAKEKCSDLVQDFVECSKKHGLLMPFKCRQQNKVMQECQVQWFKEPELYRACKAEYLEQRAEYRRTGVTQKEKRRESATF